MRLEKSGLRSEVIFEAPRGTSDRDDEGAGIRSIRVTWIEPRRAVLDMTLDTGLRAAVNLVSGMPVDKASEMLYDEVKASQRQVKEQHLLATLEVGRSVAKCMSRDGVIDVTMSPVGSWTRLWDRYVLKKLLRSYDATKDATFEVAEAALKIHYGITE
jgi:hypothetical protein